MSKNISFKNIIGERYFNKNLYLKDKLKLSKIISDILISLDSKKDTFHLFSKKFNLNFNHSDFTKFNKFKTVVLIGIGGSALGAEAIYSFCGDKIKKKFIFFDNLDQLKIEKVKKN